MTQHPAEAEGTNGSFFFCLTISLKRTNVMGRNTAEPPAIYASDYEFNAGHQFNDLDSDMDK